MFWLPSPVLWFFHLPVQRFDGPRRPLQPGPFAVRDLLPVYVVPNRDMGHCRRTISKNILTWLRPRSHVRASCTQHSGGSTQLFPSTTSGRWSARAWSPHNILLFLTRTTVFPPFLISFQQIESDTTTMLLQITTNWCLNYLLTISRSVCFRRVYTQVAVYPNNL